MILAYSMSLAVQNAAARLVSGTRRSEHITPVLRQLHWLPVQQRIEFKMAVLVYKALNGLSPHNHLMLLPATFYEPHNSGRSILHCCWSTPVE